MSTPIQKVGVVGLGLLGKGIAACCLAHGKQVVGFSRTERTREIATQFIDSAMQELVERAGFPARLTQEWKAHFSACDQLESLADVDLVIETVAEDAQIKSTIFDELEAIVASHVPIGTNTSSMPITMLQSGRRHPPRFLGTHFSENAHATRFMEVVRGEQTSADVLTRVAEFARSIGKDPVVLQKDIPAFICNRIAYAMYREALNLLELGIADVKTIDTAVRNSLGLWAPLCGPFRWIDISGGPGLYAKTLQGVMPTLGNQTTLPPIMQEMLEKNAKGIDDGQGFYSYGPGDAEQWKNRFRDAVWHCKAFQDALFPLDDDPQKDFDQ